MVGLFSFNTAIIINMYNTYFVFKLAYFIWIPSIILLIFWILYLVTVKNLYSKALTWAHIFFTITGCFYILTFPYLLTNSYEGLAGMPRRYYDIGQEKTYQFFCTLSKTAVAIAFILALGQITYCLNFFIGLSKRKGSKTTTKAFKE